MALRSPNLSFGFVPVGVPNATTYNLDDANKRQAYSFIAPGATVTLTQAMTRLFGMTGTVAASELKAELQADSAGSPSNTALETVNCNTTPAANTTCTWTFNTALTAGARYWIVFKNTNATPLSNFVSFSWGNSNSSSHPTPDATVDWARRQSTDASTWATTPNTSVTGLRVGYNDGSFEGYPFHIQATTGVGDGIYGTRELGNVFTTPNVTLTISGVKMMFGAKTGSPTGTPRLRIYIGTTILDTGASLYTISPTTGMYELSCSSSAIVLPANTVCRVAIGETTQSDASTARYNLRSYTMFDDNDTRELMPFNGTMLKTYYDGSSWTNSTTDIIPMELMVVGGSSGDGYLLVSN